MINSLSVGVIENGGDRGTLRTKALFMVVGVGVGGVLSIYFPALLPKESMGLVSRADFFKKS